MSIFSAFRLISLPQKILIGAVFLATLFVGFRVYIGLERREARQEQARKEQVARLERQLKNAQKQVADLEDAARISEEVGHEHEKALAALRGDYSALRVRYQQAWNKRAVPVAATPDAPGVAHDPAASEAQLPPEAIIVSLGDVEQCEVEARRLSGLQDFIVRYNEEFSK